MIGMMMMMIISNVNKISATYLNEIFAVHLLESDRDLLTFGVGNFGQNGNDGFFISSHSLLNNEGNKIFTFPIKTQYHPFCHQIINLDLLNLEETNWRR